MTFPRLAPLAAAFVTLLASGPFAPSARAHGDHSGRQANMIEVGTAHVPGHGTEILLEVNHNGFAAKRFGQGKPVLYVARFRVGGALAPGELGHEDPGAGHDSHGHGDAAVPAVGHLELELTPLALEKLPEIWDVKTGLYFLSTGLYRNLHLGEDLGVNVRVLGARAIREAPTLGELELMVTVVADVLGYRMRRYVAHEGGPRPAFRGAHVGSFNAELAQQLRAHGRFHVTLAAGGGGMAAYGSTSGGDREGRGALVEWQAYAELRGDLDERYQFFARAERGGAASATLDRSWSATEFLAGVRVMTGK